MSYKIKVYKAEREAGLVSAIQANASLAYTTPVEPLEIETPLAKELSRAIANLQGEQGDSFDLFYMKDIMVSTGWNKNKDIFDKGEAWAARHTPEDKPFNFEHNPLDIIGHITASMAVDVDLNMLDDALAIDELPDKFHIISGSVLYLMLPDDERKKLMQNTVAEIKKGEWFVSMECYFKGFDYGVIGPDGSQRVIARDESSAWLTKHLAQYGGSGVYVCPSTGSEFQLGRVLRNITFSGKGLVRKPANPESIIFNSAAAFVPILTESGYLTAGADATSSSKTEESIEMPETNAVEQALRDQVANLQNDLRNAAATIDGLKKQDTESAIAKLNAELTTRESTIKERDQAIANLNTQLDAAKEANKTLQERAEKAETALTVANEQLSAVKVAEQKRARLAILTEKGAEKAVAEQLAEKLNLLTDEAFQETVAMLEPAWKKTPPPLPAPQKPKTETAAAAISKAKADEEPPLATDDDELETSKAAVQDFFSKSLKSARGYTAEQRA